MGGTVGEPTIISLEELRDLLGTQQSLEDQTVCLTTVQVGFPVTTDTTEFQNVRDRFLGTPVVRFLHPVISNFMHKRLEEFNSAGQAPSHMEELVKRLEETSDGEKFELSTICRKESGSKIFTFSYGLTTLVRKKFIGS